MLFTSLPTKLYHLTTDNSAEYSKKNLVLSLEALVIRMQIRVSLFQLSLLCGTTDHLVAGSTNFTTYSLLNPKKSRPSLLSVSHERQGCKGRFDVIGHFFLAGLHLLVEGMSATSFRMGLADFMSGWGKTKSNDTPKLIDSQKQDQIVVVVFFPQLFSVFLFLFQR